MPAAQNPCPKAIAMHTRPAPQPKSVKAKDGGGVDEIIIGGAPDPTYSFPHNLVENVEALAKIVSEIQIEMRASKAEFDVFCTDVKGRVDLAVAEIGSIYRQTGNLGSTLETTTSKTLLFHSTTHTQLADLFSLLNSVQDASKESLRASSGGGRLDRIEVLLDALVFGSVGGQGGLWSQRGDKKSGTQDPSGIRTLHEDDQQAGRAQAAAAEHRSKTGAIAAWEFLTLSAFSIKAQVALCWAKVLQFWEDPAYNWIRVVGLLFIVFFAYQIWLDTYAEPRPLWEKLKNGDSL